MIYGQNRREAKTQIKQNKRKFCGYRGKCINFAGKEGIYRFCENRGNMKYASST